MTQIHMLPRDMQLANEYRFNRKHIDKLVRKEILENQVMVEKIQQGVQLLEGWLEGEYHESKQKRLNQLKQLDLEELVLDIYVGTAYCLGNELFTSVSAQLAGRLGFDDKKDSIQTVAEVLAILSETDVFDLNKPSKFASITLISRIPLSDELLEYARNSRYLPPMVCEPQHLTRNFQSAYLTHEDSLILGRGNHHEGDICLDAINLQNRIPLRLDVEFLCTVDEEPPESLNEVKDADKKTKAQITEEVRLKKEQWQDFKAQSYDLMALLAKQGNRFWLTHKVDKRGRLYSQGYHITTQGNAFRKASIELADTEVVQGVPQQ